ncbi:MAG: phosphotransacetylase [Mycoplasmoidaceae bacterium]
MEKIIKLIAQELKKAKGKKRTILFAEGWNPIIQKVALKLKDDGIIEPILLLKKKSNKKNLAMIRTIIINENDNQANIKKLLEIRKNKNLSIEEATILAAQPNYYAALLLKRNQVDAVICGIEYSTKDTIRAALQVLKNPKKDQLVSSAMMMTNKKDLLFFGDCSLNINPTAEELVQITINLCQFAKKIIKNKKMNAALLSYSTNGSGTGESVNKVKAASAILAKKKIKNINLYGEIQFDAAIDAKVRKIKVKNLNWKKDAQIFIFPNLDAANIGYKIYERCVDQATAIGPILIGLEKPMNDLSRGSSFASIVAISYISVFQAKK